MVHGLESLQRLGQSPSQVSPGSIRPLPQRAASARRLSVASRRRVSLPPSCGWVPVDWLQPTLSRSASLNIFIAKSLVFQRWMTWETRVGSVKRQHWRVSNITIRPTVGAAPHPQKQRTTNVNDQTSARSIMEVCTLVLPRHEQPSYTVREVSEIASTATVLMGVHRWCLPTRSSTP